MVLAVVTVANGMDQAETQVQPLLKTARFDRNPPWEGFNSRLVPKLTQAIQQNVEYSETNFAGKQKGENAGGVFFGYIKCGQPDGRQNTPGVRFGGEGAGARLTLQVVTAHKPVVTITK